MVGCWKPIHIFDIKHYITDFIIEMYSQMILGLYLNLGLIYLVQGEPCFKYIKEPVIRCESKPMVKYDQTGARVLAGKNHIIKLIFQNIT